MKSKVSKSSMVWWGMGLIVVALVTALKWGSGVWGGRSPFERDAGGRAGPVSSSSTADTAVAPPPSELARQAMTEGNRLLAQGQVTNAIVLYHKALQLTPNDADIHYNLGLAEARVNHLAEAEKYYRAALDLDPAYPEVHNNLGNVLSRQQRYDEAEAEFREALQLLPDYPSAYNNLGTLYQRQGKADPSLECFQKAVRLDPEYWEAWFNLGQAQFRRGEIGLAADAFREVLRIEPRFAPARRALAELEGKLGNPSPAVSE